MLTAGARILPSLPSEARTKRPGHSQHPEMKTHMTSRLLSCFLATCPFLAVAQQQYSEPGPPLKAFRCVLDGHSRVLVVNLGPNVSLAYDTENALLWKAWKPADPMEPVTLTGAAYDGKHGPQPLSNGVPYFTDPEKQFALKGAEGTVQYLGHLVDPDSEAIILRWSFEDADGKTLAIFHETPSLGENGITRKITAKHLPSGASLMIRQPGSKEIRTLSKTGDLTLTRIL